MYVYTGEIDCKCCQYYFGDEGEPDGRVVCSGHYGKMASEVDACWGEFQPSPKMWVEGKVQRKYNQISANDDEERPGLFLYKYYSKGELVYIGQTTSKPSTRLSEHKSRNKQFTTVDEVEVAKMRTRRELKLWETLLIEMHEPAWNRSDRDRFHSKKLLSLKKAMENGSLDIAKRPKFERYPVSRLREIPKDVPFDGYVKADKRFAEQAKDIAMHPSTRTS